LISALGYLQHNYQSPKNAQAVICYDENLTDSDNPQGGTGKGLFVQAPKQMRNTVIIDGKKMNLEDRFIWQDVTVQSQIVVIHDPKPSLNFSAFHSCLSDGWSIEKKNQPQFSIKPEESPKMVITSNSIVKGEGTTNKRRQYIIEFSDHYQKQIIKGIEEPIVAEHGCLFFDKDDWSKEEWNKFDNLMLMAVSDYLKNGLYSYDLINVAQNKLVQSTNEDFYTWTSEQCFEVDKQYCADDLFSEFKSTYYGDDKDFKQRKFTNWIKEFAKMRNWKYNRTPSNGKSNFTFKSI